MANLDAFRSEVRAWLEANCPESMRGGPMRPEDRVWGARKMHFPSEDAKLWFDRMVEKGWCAPDWPSEYGGGGLHPDQCRILRQELRRLRCRESQYSYGLTMIGPVLLEYGSEEQKQEFIPPIVRGEIRWCQGYSEPGAGSDLASISTSARDLGEHYLVNGQKLWTSDADKADWMYCLVRTNPDMASRQRGISFVLIDMHQPGITVKPIRLISGESPFCEVFMDNVVAQKRHLIGEENTGWTVAKRLLQHERNMMGDLATESGTEISVQDVINSHAEHLCSSDGRIADPALRQRVVQHFINRSCASELNDRALAELAAGEPSQSHLVIKYTGTEEEKRRNQLIVDMLGNRALVWEGEGFTDLERDSVRKWLNSRAYTIAGGSSEVQLNIIAKRVLELPGL